MNEQASNPYTRHFGGTVLISLRDDASINVGLYSLTPSPITPMPAAKALELSKQADGDSVFYAPAEQPDFYLCITDIEPSDWDFGARTPWIAPTSNEDYQESWIAESPSDPGRYWISPANIGETFRLAFDHTRGEFIWLVKGNDGSAPDGQHKITDTFVEQEVIPDQGALTGAPHGQLDFKSVRLFRNDLSGAHLSDCNFTHAQLSIVSFAGGSLSGSSFSNNPNVEYVNFSGADLGNTLFVNALLQSCDLSDATLAGTNFERAHLIDCTLTAKLDAAVTLTNATFDGCNFSQTEIPTPLVGGATFNKCAFGGATLFTSPHVQAATFNACEMQKATLKYLNGAKLVGCDLSGADFSAASLLGATFDNCKLAVSLKNFSNATWSGCDFSGADLSGAALGDAQFTHCHFNGADLSNVVLDYQVFQSCDFSDAKLSGISLQGTQFLNCTFSASLDMQGAALPHVTFRDCTLGGCRFDNADLRAAHFSGSTLAGCRFNGADLTQADLSYTKLGAAGMSSDFSNAVLYGANLQGADLSHAVMRAVIFFGGDAALSNATVVDVDFTGAYLQGLDFSLSSGANLAGCIFTNACLVNASFAGASLASHGSDAPVVLDGACLHGANLSQAGLQGVDLKNASISTATGTLALQGVRIPDAGGKQSAVPDPQYGPTALPGSNGTDHGTTCPNSSAGPCESAAWQRAGGAVTSWQYQAAVVGG